ncbi:hypothetical protein [Tenacibaculum sp. SDUM215027]|uniref:hypothetical protein n=1 Tax=Tenacibaculum sp. SDUM215027 TaxID=3422596 RepID=UPI003D31302D
MTEKELEFKLRTLSLNDRLVYIHILLRNSYLGEGKIHGVDSKSVFFDEKLIYFLCSKRMECIEAIINQMTLSLYREKIEYKQPIFKEKYFEASLFVMSFETWKEAVLYNLSMFSKREIKYEILELLERLNDVSNRLNHGCIIDFDPRYYSDVSVTEIVFYKDFTIPISLYKDFLRSIDVDKISDDKTFNLMYRLSNLEEKLNSNGRKNDNQLSVVLSNESNKTVLLKGLIELFRSMNLDLPENLSDLIKGFVDCVLKGDVNSFNNEEFVFLKGKKNKANRVDFVKFFVFLSYSGYILNNQTDTITILSQFLNKNEDLGFGIRTLKGEVKRGNYFMFSDEIEGGRANKRQNLISTVFYSNEDVLKKYENSKACYDVKLHLSKKNKVSNPLVS